MDKDKNEKFKQAILSVYPSVNSFCRDIGIPKTTMSSAFRSGIGNMAADKVLMMCKKLGIDPTTYEPLTSNSIILSIEELDLINRYRKLSVEHKKEVNLGIAYLLEQEKSSH